jgi:O-antigen ligase
MLVRTGLVIAGGAIAASAPISTSRLGTLAMTAFGLAVALAFLSRKRQSIAPASRVVPLFAGALLGAILVGGSVVYLYKSHGAPGGHRTWASVLRANPFGIRQMIAEDSLPMIRDKPWFGWGLGAFGGAFRFYQRTETRVVHNEGRVTLYDHAHNDWLERCVELGIIGFALFLTPGIFWLVTGARRATFAPLERWILIGCAGLMLFALGDMAFVNRAVAIAFAVLLPLTLRGADAPARTPK